jgi:hypothetical protein
MPATEEFVTQMEAELEHGHSDREPLKIDLDELEAHIKNLDGHIHQLLDEKDEGILE